MSNAVLRIFVRVVSKRLADGEDLDEILAGYTNLSDDDKEQIRKAVAKNG